MPINTTALLVNTASGIIRVSGAICIGSFEDFD